MERSPVFAGGAFALACAVAGGLNATAIFELPAASGDEITVDGHLDESAWADALVFELNYETTPGENVEPPVRTECRMFYSHSHLYYGCRAYDPSPGTIRARFGDRDSSFSDDTIGLVIDPFNDHNTAFVLDLNPLGVQNDRIYTEAQGLSDFSWDAVWDSAGRLSEDGYTVEAAIPFSSLRFPRSTDLQTWGFNFRRYRPRGSFRRIALVPYDRNDRCRTCQQAELVGFQRIDPGRNLEIVPTVTSIQTASRDDFPDGPLTSDDPDVEPGLTVNWGFSPNMALAATINPDFSQVEADIAQLDVNREFALFFRERRPFFLEGSDLFSTQFRAVHTRTLADPDWGLKLTGKEGKNAIGVFAARDAVTSLLLPGPESSSLTSLSEKSEAAVLRYRRDIGESSTVGGLYTDRRAGSYSNQVGGLDTHLRLSAHNELNVQWLSSRTDYPGGIRESNELAPGTLSGNALNAFYRHSRRNWSLRGSYRDISDDFRADLGFIPRVGFKRAVAGGAYEWFGDGDRWYTNLQAGGDWDRTETQNGGLLEEEWAFFAGMSGRQQLRFFFGGGVRDRVFQGVAFAQEFAWTSSSIQPRGDLTLGLDTTHGDAIDIAGLRGGRQTVIRPDIEWQPGRHLSAELSHRHQRFDLAEGRLFTTDLSELRLIYQFNRRAFLRLIAQLSEITRNTELYAEEVETSVTDTFGQLLFSYKLNAQTALFLGYSSSYLEVEDSVQAEIGNALFLKLGYNWQP